MTDKRTQYTEGIGWRYETEHSMLRRMQNHDYQSRCIYMLTLTLEDRSKPLLGRLQWVECNVPQPNQASQPSCAELDHAELDYADLNRSSGSVCCSSAASYRQAKFIPSPLGLKVIDEWKDLCYAYPQLKIIRLQLMPEHLHVVIFVKDRIPKHLGKLVGIVKNKSNKHYWKQLTEQGLLGPKGEQAPPSLFSNNFQDTILTHEGQLENMVQYVDQNPFRALVKRDHTDMFQVIAELIVGNQKFAAIGNRWLLDRAVKLQVRCHNNTTPENLRLIEKQKDYFLCRGTKGAVIISPCISAGEKEISRAALDAHHPLVVILENGFPPLYKPPGKYFVACAQGLLLMLAPWPYHMDKRTISRQQCLALNNMAASLCTEPWTEELEKEMKNEG